MEEKDVRKSPFEKYDFAHCSLFSIDCAESYLENITPWQSKPLLRNEGKLDHVGKMGVGGVIQGSSALIISWTRIIGCEKCANMCKNTPLGTARVHMFK